MQAASDVLATYWQSIRAEARATYAPEPEPEKCHVCHDRGVIQFSVPYDHPKFGKLFPCPHCRTGQEREAMRWQARLKNTRLPGEYQDCTFDAFDTLYNKKYRSGKELARVACQRWCENFDHAVSLQEIYHLAGAEHQDTRRRHSLLMFGPYGVGKTGMLASCVNWLMEHEQTVLYTTAQDMIASIQDTYSDHDGLTTQQVSQWYKDAPILAIDEFWMQKNSDDRRQHVQGIIRHRYGNRLPTLFTTNLDRDGLYATWGDVTAEAVCAMAHLIPMGGEPLRNTQQISQQEAF